MREWARAVEREPMENLPNWSCTQDRPVHEHSSKRRRKWKEKAWPGLITLTCASGDALAVLEEPEPGPGPGSQLLGTRAEEAILFNPPWVLSPHTYRGLTLPGWVQTVSVGRVSDATYSLRPLPPHPSLCFCPSRGPKSRPKIKAHRYYQMLMWPEDLQSLKASLESPEADQFL